MNIYSPLLKLSLACIFICPYAFKNGTIQTTLQASSTPQPANEILMVKKSIVAFLQWYKTNFHKANSFSLLIKDSRGYYMVNIKACTDYLNFMKSSKLISAKYIGYWQTYFNDKAIMLTDEKIRSDIPEHFDFVLITQEPDIFLNKIAELKLNVMSMNSSIALVGVELPSDASVEYEFEMYKVNGGWQIGYISTPNFD